MKKKFVVGLATGLLIFCMVGMAQATDISTIYANENSTTSGIDDITGNAQYVGLVNDDCKIIINGWIDENNAYDVDMYSFEITNSKSLFFDIDYANDINNSNDDDTGVDTVLSIFNLNNMILSYNDDSRVFDGDINDPGSAPNGDLDSLIGALEVSAGIYYVAVSSYGNSPDSWDNAWNAAEDGLEWEESLPFLSVSGYLVDGILDTGSLFSGLGDSETTGSYQLVISEDFDGAASIPVPATILLLCSGLGGLACLNIGRKKR
ncbi:MAG: DVUA0089 family protein [Desulfosarcina sp.]|nr:DVUA0089 family protein [Desulfobacterales bacterium]